MPSRPIIQSLQNTWIKEILQLQRTSTRRQSRRFLIEGTHLLQEALATNWPVESICFTQPWLDKNKSLLQSFPANTLRQEVSQSVLAKIATTESPDGVVAVASSVPSQSATQNANHASGLISLGVAVESLQDPGNLGSLIRVAAATNADGIFLSTDSVDPTGSKVLRSTAGQWFRKPPVVTELPSLIEKCHAASVQVFAAAADGECYWDINLKLPTLFVLGNEGRGLTSQIRSQIRRSIAIPMATGVESLNVAMTGGILLYEANRQRRG